ncbi:MAG: hypothetical protein AB7S41_18295 [Parvibaculaceae bacterium]
MDWYESGGGALLGLDPSLLPHWVGYPDPGYEEISNDASRYLSLADIGSGKGIVLWGEPLPAAFDQWRSLIVRAMWVDDEKAMQQFFLNPVLDKSDMTETVQFNNASLDLVFFDSAYGGERPEILRNGKMVSKLPSLHLPSASTTIYTYEIEKDGAFAAVVHEFAARPR